MNTNLTSFPSGYSPPIEMTLELPGLRLSVAEVAPHYIVIEPPLSVAPAEAILVITVDGRSTRRRVFLPDGVCPGVERQPLIILETGLPSEQPASPSL